MRLRNKNWTKGYLKNHQTSLIDADQEQIVLANQFQTKNEINALEIGCGKGDFLIQQALNHLDWNFVAFEKESTVVGVALRKALTSHPELVNLKFMNGFAEKLTTIFPNDTFDYLFLNFSDPWPKAKHFKKRLTYQAFLEAYWQILKPGGTIELKTDNDQLYAFSLEQIQAHGQWVIVYQTTDLYRDEAQLKTNVPTEYEQRFHQLGKPIKKIVLQTKKNLKK